VAGCVRDRPVPLEAGGIPSRRRPRRDGGAGSPTGELAGWEPWQRLQGQEAVVVGGKGGLGLSWEGRGQGE
jgi:hypothetical protein